MTKEPAISPDDIISQESGSVLRGLDDYCTQLKADLLIVSTKKRSFLEEFIVNPSLTKKLIVNTHLPLLVYHLS